MKAGWLTTIDGEIKVVHAEVDLDHLPGAMEWIKHPKIENGKPMQVVSIGLADHENMKVDIGLSTPLPMPDKGT